MLVRRLYARPHAARDAALGPATAKDACVEAAYTVFGCGNTEWAATYQAVPKLIDSQLDSHGARQVHPRGEGDARGDFDAQFRSWHSGLWTDLADALRLPVSAAEPAATGPRLSITVVNRQLTNPVILSYQGLPALVRGNRELNRNDGAPPERSTRHVEIALPEGTTYQAGDHLGVLPRNDYALIQRVMRRFTLDAGTYLTIIPNSGTHTHLPIDEPAPLLGVLGSCVELQDVATRSDIETMARYTDDPGQRAELESLAGDSPESHAKYRERVFVPYRSIVDLLDEFPSCKLPFEVYLDLLPPLRPRYYSISSSALASPEVCSVTTGVLQAPARGGDGDFTGVCSNYLARTAPNNTLFAFVRKPTIAFRPPADPSTPMIMVGAGTGLAPFRGFLQERAALAERQGDRGIAAVLRLPEPRPGLHLRRRAARPRQAVLDPGLPGVLPEAGERARVRPARGGGARRRGLGPAGAGCGGVRVRQREHDRPGGAGRAHRDLPEQDRRVERPMPRHGWTT